MPQTAGAKASIEDILRAQAVRTAAALIKNRARTYAKSPILLDTVSRGLSAATPDTIIAVEKNLILMKRNLPRRWFGAGGEIPLINAKAALLYGRARCRAASRQVGKTARLQTPAE